jgi:hypothetical protein
MHATLCIYEDGHAVVPLRFSHMGLFNHFRDQSLLAPKVVSLNQRSKI